MTWGTGPWGTGPWGSVGAESIAVPTLIVVQSEPGPTAETSSPAVVDERGGTVCLAFGTNFYSPITIEVLIGAVSAYEVVGSGYVVDPEFDLESNRVYFGSPALERGLYHVRITTPSGSSAVLENALAARRFAEEFKTLSSRGKFAGHWAAGPRLLRG